MWQHERVLDAFLLQRHSAGVMDPSANAGAPDQTEVDKYIDVVRGRPPREVEPATDLTLVDSRMALDQVKDFLPICGMFAHLRFPVSVAHHMLVNQFRGLTFGANKGHICH